MLWPQKQKRLRMGDLKKLVCIYTCEKDRHSLSQIKKTKLYKQLKLNDSCHILEVYAGASEVKLEDGAIHLNCPEEYSKLSLKTYEMITQCCSRFDFDYLFKIDCNVFEHGNNGVGFPEEIRSDLFREEFIEKLILDDSYFKSDYIGSAISHIRTSESLSKWATCKNLNVAKLKPQHRAPFFTGKFYGMSRSFCEFIAKNGKSESYYFADNYGGAEDVYMGYMFSKYKKVSFKSELVLDYISNIVATTRHPKTKQYLKRLIDICGDDFKKFEFEQRNCVTNSCFEETEFNVFNSYCIDKLSFLRNELKV
tara:strand:+ start:184 stop:1110 length:927 start_codon:yes stop_codon:yes gene_type:complete